jgi:hypothetical protein
VSNVNVNSAAESAVTVARLAGRRETPPVESNRSPEDYEALRLSRALCQRLTEDLNLWRELIATDNPGLLVRHVKGVVPKALDAVDRVMRSVDIALGDCHSDEPEASG